MLTLILATTLLTRQTPAPESLTLGGRQVALTFPAPASAEPPAGYLDWKGWGYRTSSIALPKGAYPTVADWQPYSASTPAADAKPWKMKIVFFTSTDILDRYASGLIRQRRGFIGDADLSEALASVARYRAVLASRTGGKLNFEPDVAVDTNLLRGEVGKSATDRFALTSVVEWVRANVNGGTYESEDNVYRGPYDGVLAIVPGAPPAADYAEIVDGTPVVVTYLRDRAILPGTIEKSLDDAVLKCADLRGRMAGYEGKDPVSGDPSEVAALGAPTAQEAIARESKSFQAAFTKPGSESSVLSWRAPNTELSIVTGTDRGAVLHYKELSRERSGGFVLPSPAEGWPTGTLTFFVRTKSVSPIALTMVGKDGKTVSVSLGRDMLPPPYAEAASPAVAFTPDGTWQPIAIDLRGVSPVERIEIGPTPNARIAERNEVGSVEYDFDAFNITQDPAPAAAVIANPELDDAMKAVNAVSTQTLPKGLDDLLASPSDLVLLNVLNAYTTLKDPTVVKREAPAPAIDISSKAPPPLPKPLPSLETAMSSLSPRRQEYALKAIANQDTDESWAFLKRQVLVGASDIAKGVAASLVAKKDGANNLDLLSTLIDHPGRFAKTQAIDAIASIGSPASKVILGTFIFHADPQIKLAVTNLIGPSDNTLLDKAMWSAVNEPWDSVRFASLVKLVQAKAANYKTEGYKGVRDDSVGVRLSFVAWMGAYPDEAHLPALKLALSDQDYRVRAAALNALTRQPGTIKAEEVQTLKNDPYPSVREAVERLAQVKGL